MTHEYAQEMLLKPALVWLMVALPVFIGSLLLFRRVRMGATLFLLIGATAYLLGQTMHLFLLSMMPLVLDHRGSPFIAAIWPSCTPHSAFYVAERFLGAISLCFPLALVWLVLRSTRQHLTNR